MPEIVFMVLAVAILGALVWSSYKTGQKRFPFMFAVALPCLCCELGDPPIAEL